MNRLRTWQGVVLCTLLGGGSLRAADFSSYRGFQFGASLASAAKQAGMKPSDARTICVRPATIQELEWRPSSLFQIDAKGADPVREVLLRFYNGELFQIVATYERQRVEGMTEADMVEAISATYGAATKPAVQIPYHSYYGETAAVIARWEEPEYSYNLVRTGDQTAYALIASLKRLDVSAQAAVVEALRLDALEAPQKAIALQKKQDADQRLMLEKARALNMANFRP
jgi:hypothetical protein